jgi:hypothetical protein
MNILLIITAIVFLIYLSIYEGSVLAMKDAIEGGKSNLIGKFDQFRHGWSTLLRCAVVPISFFYFWHLADLKHGIWIVLLFIFLAWTGWNIICNLSRGKSVFYKGSKKSGTSSFFDKLISNIYLYWGLQALVLIALVVCFILWK